MNSEIISEIHPLHIPPNETPKNTPMTDSSRLQHTDHAAIVSFVWALAEKLRGPYRPPQYRKVMLPLVVMRRLDLVLEATKETVLAEHSKLEARGFTGAALEKALSRVATGEERTQPLYNISRFTFQKLLGDPADIAQNLLDYMRGFSPLARDIFDKFEFENEIQKLDESNRLFLIIKEFCSPQIDLSPRRISNLQMGYVFEELVRRFNEQANEEAGDHFTPREVIRLMVNLVFSEEEDVFKPGIYRSIYDPTAGTGGMLSVAEEYIKRQNPDANLDLFGQEYNPEAFAICCSDLLIKDEAIDKLIFGDTLGVKESKARGNNYVAHDGHPNRRFHYMFANPPYGVEWRPQEDFVKEEYNELGFDGRFGPGLPRINDGSLLFLLHMIAKRHPAPGPGPTPDTGGDGSRIAIVFNGSPLFTGDAGSGESNIRRWIIENDWLDAVVALPDQLFYNTGIYTYIWLVTNKKPAQRRGKVQLIDGTRHYQKMKKSLGNKRNELSDEQIAEIVRLYGENRPDGASDVAVNGTTERRVCSKIFDNRAFGFLKLTVERPLRLNFQASPERIARLWEQTAFVNLARSNKRKERAAQQADIAAGEAEQQALLDALAPLDPAPLYRSRPAFEKTLNRALKAAEIKLSAPLRKAVLAALGETDPGAEICRDSKGNPEPDSSLRDTEIVPLPDDISLPLPLQYDDKQTGLDDLLAQVRGHCQDYLAAEVLPHVADAWIDYSKTKVGYEIPLNRHFYVYQPPEPLAKIEAEIRELEAEIIGMLGEVV